MSSEPKEARFHGIFYTRLLDFLKDQDTPFLEPVSEKPVNGGSADIFIPSNLLEGLVIEVKRDDIYPREQEVIKQARDYARDLGTSYFATCNSNDLFLFHYQGEWAVDEIDFYYFNLRDHDSQDVIAQLIGLVQYVHEEKELPTQDRRERIVGVLRSFHSSIWPTFKALAEDKYNKNEKFIRDFDEWVRENDYTELEVDEQFETASKQYAYLLTNKILFYEVVRSKTPDEIQTSSGYPLDPLHGHTTLESLDNHIKTQFEKIMTEIDYEPIFEEGSSLFSAFPQNKKTLETINDFLKNIGNESITELDEDLLGEIYEELIPINERKALGQFYTPPKIAETLCKWSIEPTEDGLPRILDPASGSGTFPIEAYHRLAQLYPDSSHQEIIDQITAIDINRFPLHLTALNLASQNISEETNALHLYNDSFFNIDPDTDPFEHSRIDEARHPGKVGKFDAIVANPPYIRSQSLYPDKEHFRKHLKRFTDRNNNTPYYDGEKRFSKKCDAYIYFITHATQFLKENGRLGFIIPTKWMSTRYGRNFQHFLFDHYEVKGIVGFTARAFEDALVDTVLLLLERCEEPRKRDENVVNFIRIKEAMEPDDILDTVNLEYDVADNDVLTRNRPYYRLVSLRQKILKEAETGKIDYYLKSPLDIIKLLENGHMTAVGDIAHSRKGVMTGANEFFLLDSDDLDVWDIDGRFLKPAIKTIKDVDSQVLNQPVGWYIFDIHDYVEETKSESDFTESDIETRVKRALKRDGYTDTCEYIEQGERDGHHEKYNTVRRSVWFDLGELSTPEILFPRTYNENVFVIWNKAKLVPTDRLVGIYLENPDLEEASVGIFNSTVQKSIMECWGTSQGAGSLDLTPNDVSTLPILDAHRLDTDEIDSIRKATRSLLDGEDNAQTELDRIILDIMNVDINPDKLQKFQQNMMKRRVSGGAETEVLVERLDDLEDIGVETFTIGEPDSKNTSLGDFQT